MTKETAIAIMGGALSALLMAGAGPLFGGTLTPPAMMLAYLAPFPLLLVGFGLGVPAVIKAAVAAAVASAVAANVVYGLMFAVLVAAPAVLLTSIVLTRRPTPDGRLAWTTVGHTSAVLCAFAAGAIVLAAVLAAGMEGGLFGQLEKLAGAIAAELSAALADGMPVQRRELGDAFVALAPYAPAFVGVSWLLMLAVNGALAQSLLRRAGRNLRPSPAFAEFTVPAWLSIAWAAAILARIAFDGTLGALATNVALVLTMPFFFAGLAVVHAWAARLGVARRGTKGLVLLGLYGSLMLIQMPIVLLLIATGVIDDVANLRRHAGAVPTLRPARDSADNDED